MVGDAVLIAIITAVGTIVCGLVSAIMANRVTVYKIEVLTKEVEKHNSVIERTFHLEQWATDTNQIIRDHDNRISRIESLRNSK